MIPTLANFTKHTYRLLTHTNNVLKKECKLKEEIAMGRTKKANANAQSKNNEKLNQYKNEFASEHSAHNPQQLENKKNQYNQEFGSEAHVSKAKKASKAKGKTQYQYTQEFGSAFDTNQVSSKQASKQQSGSKYGQEFGTYADIEAAKLNNQMQKKKKKR